MKEFDWRTHNWEDCVGEGWRPLVRCLVAEHVKRDLPITQVKEKFGTLRFYANGLPTAHKFGWWNPRRWPKPLWRVYWGVARHFPGAGQWVAGDWLEELVWAVEEASGHICEECGAPGKVVSPHGWMRTACPACLGKRP